jgi:hypothetical protein
MIMENEKEIISVFLDKNSERDLYGEPFKNDERICATCGTALIAIDKNRCEGNYKVLETPDIKKYLLMETNRQETLLLPELEQMMNTAERIEETVTSGENIKCTECDGSGEVEWDYKDFSEYFDCPVCKGSGYTSVSRKKKTGRTIPDPEFKIKLGNRLFRLAVLEKLIKTMQLMHSDSCIYKYSEESLPEAALFQIDKDVTVVLSPTYPKY